MKLRTACCSAPARVNDWVGRWLLGFPSFTPIDLYRRGHMAHHRDEFGPEEPDIPLYRGYPIARASLRRKLTRDATGRTGFKLFKGLLRGVRSSRARGAIAGTAHRRGADRASWHRHRVASPVGVFHLVVGALSDGMARVINRLRSIAEHGGMERSKDRRLTTHSVRQSFLSRFFVVPYHIGWHLAHHVDSGVPMANLPTFHAELRRAGYVTDTIEYPSYLAVWAKLSGR